MSNLLYVIFFDVKSQERIFELEPYKEKSNLRLKKLGTKTLKKKITSLFFGKSKTVNYTNMMKKRQLTMMETLRKKTFAQLTESSYYKEDSIIDKLKEDGADVSNQQQDDFDEFYDRDEHVCVF